MQYDVIIVGGGIVGLACGYEIIRQYPKASVLVLEKENRLAQHQTAHNSGVIHSGIYYRPGSLKARFAREGNRSLVSFCRKHGICHEVTGKVIVAVENSELPALDQLYKRGVENGLPVEKINREELRKIEPFVSGIAAIRVASTGIVDFREVSKVLAAGIEKQGQIRLQTRVENISEEKDGVVVDTNRGTFTGRFLVNCAGLYSDRIAEKAGIYTDIQIVPFRGEYYELKKEKRFLVRHLIYPVPDPRFPFLGVHFTRTVDGRVLVGPNAVLSFRREGYRKGDFSISDAMESFAFPGLWRLVFRYMGAGIKEMHRSFSKKAFVADVRRFFPQISEDDLQPAVAGVRAQALRRDGALLDDFALIETKRQIHVCNAPSPAATASLEIGKKIVGDLAKKWSFPAGGRP